MKTSYYLVTAAGLAAAATAYAFAPFPTGVAKREIPSIPVPAEPPAPGLLPVPAIPDVPLPPIVTPPHGELVITSGALPLPIPETPQLPAPPAATPTLELPAPPAPLPIPSSVPPVAVPAIPVIPPAANSGGLRPPLVRVVPPEENSGGVRPPLVPMPEANSEKPDPMLLPAPKPIQEPAANLAPTGKFVVLKGNKLIEGAVSLAGEKVIVRQGSLDRTLPKADVLYVAASRDEIYKYMLAKVPATDAAGRMAVARWCTISGMREQGLVEAREILKLDPTNRAAADLARSLDESLRQFPAGGSAPAKPQGALVTVTEPEPDVTAEGATAYATKAQPVLANQCMECHGRADYAGTFKLTRVTGFEAGPQTNRANLRAVAAQLKKDDPLNSPLLVKALTVHGTMKQPAFVSRQAGGYRMLEAWTLLAIGTGTPAMTPPVQPVFPTAAPATPIPPAEGTAQVVPPLPVAVPKAPPVGAVIPAPSVLPPVEPEPVILPVLPVPPAVNIPPVLPTPPSLPPAEVGKKVPQLPVVPKPVPLNSNMPLPGEPAVPGQFGSSAPPKPAPAGPTGGDEFDPAAFNRSVQPGK